MTKRQWAILALVLAVFAAFNLALYGLVTVRCADHLDRQTKYDAIDVAAHVPFSRENRLAVVDEPTLQLTGDLPVLDGAAALLPVYAGVCQAVYPAEACIYDDGYAPDSAMQYRNTLEAYRAVVDGDADVIFCAGPSQAQRDYAAQAGVELVYTPIGREAFVFLVNGQNPVSDLSADQIRAIYAGEITNWSQVGGPDRLINPTTRYAGSGSQSVMDAFMGDTAIVKPPLALLGGAIGFSFRYYVADVVGRDTVKMLSVNGVEPTPANIAGGTYPLVVEFYAVHRAEDPNSNVDLLVAWLLSDQGQQLIEDSGYSRIQ